MKVRLFGLLIPLALAGSALAAHAQQPTAVGSPAPPSMQIARTDDFTVDGTGSAPAWAKAEWVALAPRGANPAAPRSRVKTLYSPTGLYVLMDADDARITATMKEDFLHLWTEDVFEFFLWTDERWPVYFEYEISPLGFELPILIPNFNGQFLGWRPWDYDGARKIRKAVSVRGGQAAPGAAISGWRAEVFLPYDLLEPLQNVPPQPGAKWRANFYRMDYDAGRGASWAWAPVTGTFHNYQKFGTLIFQ